VNKLARYVAPDNNRIFTKSYPERGQKRRTWAATKENNGYLVWRGHCLDSEPWDESSWMWEIREHHDSRDAAIEACLMAALEESKSADLSAAHKTLASRALSEPKP
jgi:hypothetical protein